LSKHSIDKLKKQHQLLCDTIIKKSSKEGSIVPSNNEGSTLVQPSIELNQYMLADNPYFYDQLLHFYLLNQAKDSSKTNTISTTLVNQILTGTN